MEYTSIFHKGASKESISKFFNRIDFTEYYAASVLKAYYVASFNHIH